jgi:hypothetical protein
MEAQEREFKKILKGHSAPVAKTGAALRRLLYTAAPTLREQVLPGYARYWNKGAVICAITIHQDHVNLQFYYGADISDPRQILVGTGKRLRHISIRQPEDIRERDLTRMIREAAKRDTR